MILVTGGAGFIGSHLVRRLERDGHEVRVADIKNGFDLRRLSTALDACAGADTVYHLAADMGGIGYITKDHARIAHDNTLIDLNVLEAARLTGVKRLWYAGSACAYPSGRQQFLGMRPLQEAWDSPGEPEPGYGWAKLYGEKLCRYYREDFGMDVKVTRFFNVYGPEATYDGSREKALMALIRKVANAPNGGEIEVWGDGRQARDFIYADDAVELVLRVMASNEPGPVNIGTGIFITIDELVMLVAKVVGKHVTIRHDESKPQGVRWRVADTRLMLNTTGYTPKVSLEEGIRRSWEWMRESLRSYTPPSRAQTTPTASSSSSSR